MLLHIRLYFQRLAPHMWRNAQTYRTVSVETARPKGFLYKGQASWGLIVFAVPSLLSLVAILGFCLLQVTLSTL